MDSHNYGFWPAGPHPQGLQHQGVPQMLPGASPGVQPYPMQSAYHFAMSTQVATTAVPSFNPMTSQPYFYPRPAGGPHHAPPGLFTPQQLGSPTPVSPTWSSDPAWTAETGTNNSISEGQKHIAMQFMEILREHGPQESSSEHILNCFLRLKTGERKHVMSLGSIKAFLKDLDLIKIEGNTMLLNSERINEVIPGFCDFEDFTAETEYFDDEENWTDEQQILFEAKASEHNITISLPPSRSRQSVSFSEEQTSLDYEDEQDAGSEEEEKDREMSQSGVVWSMADDTADITSDEDDEECIISDDGGIVSESPARTQLNPESPSFNPAPRTTMLSARAKEFTPAFFMTSPTSMVTSSASTSQSTVQASPSDTGDFTPDDSGGHEIPLDAGSCDAASLSSPRPSMVNVLVQTTAVQAEDRGVNTSQVRRRHVGIQVRVWCINDASTNTMSTETCNQSVGTDLKTRNRRLQVGFAHLDYSVDVGCNTEEEGADRLGDYKLVEDELPDYEEDLIQTVDSLQYDEMVTRAQAAEEALLTLRLENELRRAQTFLDNLDESYKLQSESEHERLSKEYNAGRQDVVEQLEDLEAQADYHLSMLHQGSWLNSLGPLEFIPPDVPHTLLNISQADNEKTVPISPTQNSPKVQLAFSEDASSQLDASQSSIPSSVPSNSTLGGELSARSRQLSTSSTPSLPPSSTVSGSSSTSESSAPVGGPLMPASPPLVGTPPVVGGIPGHPMHSPSHALLHSMMNMLASSNPALAMNPQLLQQTAMQHMYMMQQASHSHNASHLPALPPHRHPGHGMAHLPALQPNSHPGHGEAHIPALAPNSHPDHSVVPLSALPPNSHPGHGVGHLSALPPNSHPDHSVVPLSALPPNSHPGHGVGHLSALPPNSHPDHSVAPLSALPPNSQPSHGVAHLSTLPPNSHTEHSMTPLSALPPNSHPGQSMAPLHALPPNSHHGHSMAPLHAFSPSSHTPDRAPSTAGAPSGADQWNAPPGPAAYPPGFRPSMSCRQSPSPSPISHASNSSLVSNASSSSSQNNTITAPPATSDTSTVNSDVSPMAPSSRPPGFSPRAKSQNRSTDQKPNENKSKPPILVKQSETVKQMSLSPTPSLDVPLQESWDDEVSNYPAEKPFSLFSKSKIVKNRNLPIPDKLIKNDNKLSEPADQPLPAYMRHRFPSHDDTPEGSPPLSNAWPSLNKSEGPSSATPTMARKLKPLPIVASSVPGITPVKRAEGPRGLTGKTDVGGAGDGLKKGKSTTPVTTPVAQEKAALIQKMSASKAPVPKKGVQMGTTLNDLDNFSDNADPVGGEWKETGGKRSKKKPKFKAMGSGSGGEGKENSTYDRLTSQMGANFPNLSKFQTSKQNDQENKTGRKGVGIDTNSNDLSAGNLLYKTSICEYWKAGSCVSGDRCVFAHGRHEIRPPPKHIMCSNWKKLGKCPHTACLFAHGEAERTMPPPPPAGSAAQARLLKEKKAPAPPSSSSITWAQAPNPPNSFPRSPESEDYEEDVGETCAICCDPMSVKTKEKLECQHEFHGKCIKRWIKGEERTCPLCRSHALLIEDYPYLGQ